MANEQHLDILKQGVDSWNQWRKEHPDIEIDLTFAKLDRAHLSAANLNGVDLSGAELIRAHLVGTDLSKANLRGTDLSKATLRGANLTCASLIGADLSYTYITKANLSGAHLKWASLRGADLSEANLRGADLSETDLTFANLTKADLTGCSIYAIVAWDVQLKNTIQHNLIITRRSEPTITVDDFEVAQFIYPLLNNQSIRHVIDTITSKFVLILGSFSDERKHVLHAMLNEFRKRNYSPIVFDFGKQGKGDFTERVFALAQIARFVLADITEVQSILQVLERILPRLPSIPVQFLLQASASERDIPESLTKYPNVLGIYRYHDASDLLQAIQERLSL